MNPRPPVDDAAIEPTRTLSFSNPRDFFEVLAWTLWAPLMFVFYTRRFVLPNDRNTLFPDLATSLNDQREVEHWRQKNPAQWELVKIAGGVGLLLLVAVVVLNALCMLPLPRFSTFDIVLEALMLTVWLFLLLTLQLIGGWWVAGRSGNVGYLLAAALPGGVALAFMVLFSLWVQHLPAYLVSTSPWMLFVFALWGYATGFYVNFVLAVAYRRINRFAYLLLALLVVTLGATAFLLTLRGVTLQTYAMAWKDENRFVLWAGLWWGGGLILGVLRMVEWLLCEFQGQPSVTDTPTTRGWTLPGATQVPIDRLQAEIDLWLHFDWQRGVNVVAAVARVAGQERPWAGALRGRLAADDGEDIVERLAAVYDCGIKRASVVLKPPKPKKTTGTASAGGGGSGAPAKPKGQKRYQQELLLAKAIGHKLQAPLLDQEGDQRSREAAFWYYDQGYLFEASDILERLNGASSNPLSAPVEELRVLAATFKVFLDLAAVSRLPTVARPGKPLVCQRTAAWEVIDKLADAARWAWRARCCKDRDLRIYCKDEFDNILIDLKSRIGAGHLAERTLVLGIIKIWENQIKVVLQ